MTTQLEPDGTFGAKAPLQDHNDYRSAETLRHPKSS
jgi:hypothetical protein